MATSSVDCPNYIKFVISATAGVSATAFSYPLELLKNRMQVSGEGGAQRDHANVAQFAKAVYKENGIFGFYSGFSASALRQVMYTGSRMGMLQTMMDYYTVDGKSPTFVTKLIIGIVSGGLGAMCGLPADVPMIRMAVDNRLPPEKRRNYKNVFDALIRIYKEEGIKTWFRGFTPTIIRAMVINTSQVVTYMQVKEMLIKLGLMEDNLSAHIVCSFWAALTATVCSLPLDIAKTRIQNMKDSSQYSGIMDVWVKTVKKEGFFALWKGFTPYFVKNGPQTVLFFIFYERLFIFYNTYLK